MNDGYWEQRARSLESMLAAFRPERCHCPLCDGTPPEEGEIRQFLYLKGSWAV